MRRAVPTGLPPETAPFSHAVIVGGWLHTATLPVRPDGSLETGSGAAQAEAALANLRQAVEAAGLTLDDVGQVVVYLTRPEDKPAMDEVYARVFRKPYPSRVCVVVSALAVSGARIEIQACAALPA
jgi:enamine deaminase RidA (YjgF/YER057c/UK114 family)